MEDSLFFPAPAPAPAPTTPTPTHVVTPMPPASPGSVLSCDVAFNASSMPCIRDNVIIEFRPTNSYDGEFGFDWMRVYEAPDVAGSPESGYAESSYGKELPYIDAQDVTAAKKQRGWNEANGMANLSDRVGLVIGGLKLGSTIPAAEMTLAETKTEIEKEYTRFEIVRGDTVDYRLKTYFVPYLALFPKGTPPLWETRNAMDAFHLKLADPLPLPPWRATLDVLYDIKDSEPDKITLEYDPRYLEISRGSFAPDMGSPAHNLTTPPLAPTPAGTKPPMAVFDLIGAVTTTNRAYAENLARRDTITIACINTIPGDTEIIAYAHKLGEPKTPVGKMIVLANHVLKKIKVALVEVETNIQKHPINKTGIFNTDELTCLYRTLHQALILPDVVNWHANSGRPITLDLSNEAAFQEPSGARTISATPETQQQSVTPSGITITTTVPGTPESRTWPTVPNLREAARPGSNVRPLPGQYVTPFVSSSGACAIYSDYDNGFELYLDQLMKAQYPALGGSHYLAFNFAEKGRRATEFVGIVMRRNRRVDGKWKALSNSSLSIYEGRNRATLPHELLHALELDHTHRDQPDAAHPNPKLGKMAKYVFPYETTTNILSYNRTAGGRHTTWKWQWDIMRANAEIIIRDANNK